MKYFMETQQQIKERHAKRSHIKILARALDTIPVNRQSTSSQITSTLERHMWTKEEAITALQKLIDRP